MNEAAPRPTQVTIAYAFQLAIAGALLLGAGLIVADAIHYHGLIDEAARAVPTADPAEVADERTGSWMGALVFGVPCLILAVWLGISAIGLRRGSNVARILSAVGLGAPLAVGLILCCGGSFFGLAGLVAVGALGDDGYVDDGGYEDEDFDDYAGDPFYDKLDSLDSGTFSTVLGSIGGSLALIVLLLGVSTMILLFTGPARRYFRPPPVMPLYGYPPVLGYPPYAPPIMPAPWAVYPPPPFPAPPFPAPPGTAPPGTAPPGTAPPGTAPPGTAPSGTATPPPAARPDDPPVG